MRFAYLGLLLIGSGAGDEQLIRASAEAASVESMSNDGVNEESRSGSVMVGVDNKQEEVDEPISNDSVSFGGRSESMVAVGNRRDADEMARPRIKVSMKGKSSGGGGNGAGNANAAAITAAFGYIDEELNTGNDGSTQKDVASNIEGRVIYETAMPIDDASYTNRFGLSCSQHELLRCNALQKIGYTLHDVEELLRKCPQSCALSVSSSTGYGEDDVGAVTGGGADRFPRPTKADKGTRVHYTTRQRKPSQTTVPDSTKPQDQPICFDGKCQDEVLYRSKLGLPCKRFALFDCSQFVSVGFTANETMELLDNCPCSCKVECW